MGFLKNLFGGGPQKYEEKGDELRLDLQHRDAAFYYRKALDALKEEDPATRGRIETKLREVRRKTVAELLEEATELVHDGDLDLAEERLDTASDFADDPTAQSEVERRLAELEDLRGERQPQVETDVPEEVASTEDDLFELALSGLDEADREHAAGLGEEFRLAYEACQQENWAEARTGLAALLAERPEDALLLELAALAAERTEREDEALELYRRAHAVAPDRAATVQGLVTSLRGADHTDEAAEVLAGAVAGHPPDGALDETWVELHVEHARDLSRRGNHDDAVDALRALHGEPAMNNALLCFNLAGVLEAAGRDEECRGALEKAVEIAPRVSVYHERLSDFLVKRGVELDAALALLVQANQVETTAAAGMFGGGGGKATVSPNRPRYLYKMARIYYLKGEDREADKTITTALAVTEDPSMRQALEELRAELNEART